MIRRIIVPLKESVTDDKMQIISLEVSPREEYVAALTGKLLIKGQKELH